MDDVEAICMWISVCVLAISCIVAWIWGEKGGRE